MMVKEGVLGERERFPEVALFIELWITLKGHSGLLGMGQSLEVSFLSWAPSDAII